MSAPSEHISILNPIVADIVPAQNLEGLYVVPHAHVDVHAVGKIVRSVLPDMTFQRSANRLLLKCDSAQRLSEHALPIRWTPEAVRYLTNRMHEQRYHARALSSIYRLRAEGRLYADHLMPASALGQLDDHQVVNVAAMTLPNSPGLCLFDEQGAGKTVSLIYAFDELVHRDEIDFLLIISPKSMVAEWEKEFEKFTGDLYKVRTLSGTSVQKRMALHKGADVLIANFESSISLEAELDALLRSFKGRCAIAIDESFFIKSPDALRTNALRRLREWCNRAYVLCGTPAPNSPVDLVEQFNFVDFGSTFENVQIPMDRSLALPIIQAAINERGLFLRNLKSQVLPDLPGKSFQTLLVDLSPRQAELYQAALQVFVENLRKTSDEQFRRQITNFLSQRSMLLQICSNPNAVTEGYDETPAKLLAMDKIIEELVVRQKEKIIIWSFYTETIDKIMMRYRDYGAVRYDGKISSIEDRREAVRRFQNDDSTQIFVANPAAAGAGLTLHRARFSIYESMSNQAAHYLQSLDRIHRRGQSRSVEYIVLLGKGTIEESEYARLLRKENSAQMLLSDDVAPSMTRTQMLAEALHQLSGVI